MLTCVSFSRGKVAGELRSVRDAVSSLQSQLHLEVQRRMEASAAQHAQYAGPNHNGGNTGGGSGGANGGEHASGGVASGVAVNTLASEVGELRAVARSGAERVDAVRAALSGDIDRVRLQALDEVKELRGALEQAMGQWTSRAEVVKVEEGNESSNASKASEIDGGSNNGGSSGDVSRNVEVENMSGTIEEMRVSIGVLRETLGEAMTRSENNAKGTEEVKLLLGAQKETTRTEVRELYTARDEAKRVCDGLKGDMEALREGVAEQAASAAVIAASVASGTGAVAAPAGKAEMRGVREARETVELVVGLAERMETMERTVNALQEEKLIQGQALDVAIEQIKEQAGVIDEAAALNKQQARALDAALAETRQHARLLQEATQATQEATRLAHQSMVNANRHVVGTSSVESKEHFDGNSVNVPVPDPRTAVVGAAGAGVGAGAAGGVGVGRAADAFSPVHVTPFPESPVAVQHTSHTSATAASVTSSKKDEEGGKEGEQEKGAGRAEGTEAGHRAAARDAAFRALSSVGADGPDDDIDGNDPGSNPRPFTPPATRAASLPSAKGGVEQKVEAAMNGGGEGGGGSGVNPTDMITGSSGVHSVGGSVGGIGKEPTLAQRQDEMRRKTAERVARRKSGEGTHDSRSSTGPDTDAGDGAGTGTGGAGMEKDDAGGLPMDVSSKEQRASAAAGREAARLKEAEDAVAMFKSQQQKKKQEQTQKIRDNAQKSFKAAEAKAQNEVAAARHRAEQRRGR